jgi:hypothetical protein
MVFIDEGAVHAELDHRSQAKARLRSVRLGTASGGVNDARILF